VSTVAKQLDAVVAAFHARALKERYRVLMLDGVVLARKTGAGAIRRPVLVAWAYAATVRRKSSISTWRRARAPPNGSAFSAT
jgi:transposase-like protein